MRVRWAAVNCFHRLREGAFCPVNPWCVFQRPPVLRRPSLGPKVRERQDYMKLLFFSNDGSEVEQVGRELTHAGIPCEIRGGLTSHQGIPETELWVQNDGDCPRGFMVCVQLGIGFAKRVAEAAAADC